MEVWRIFGRRTRVGPRICILLYCASWAVTIPAVDAFADSPTVPLPSARPALESAQSADHKSDSQDSQTQFHESHEGSGSEPERAENAWNSAHRGNEHQHSVNPQKKVRHINDIDELFVVGVNTDSIDLKTVLSPGTIIHFWASWCRPCAEEIPELERFYRVNILDRAADEGIQLITISNDSKAAHAEWFIKQHDMTFPVYWDFEQTSNLAMIGRRSLPSTVMVGGDGRFHRLALGKLDWAYPDLPKIIETTAALRSNAADIAEDVPTGNK